MISHFNEFNDNHVLFCKIYSLHNVEIVNDILSKYITT